jgi:hypothetical protein
MKIPAVGPFAKLAAMEPPTPAYVASKKRLTPQLL